MFHRSALVLSLLLSSALFALTGTSVQVDSASDVFLISWPEKGSNFVVALERDNGETAEWEFALVAAHEQRADGDWLDMPILAVRPTEPAGFATRLLMDDDGVFASAADFMFTYTQLMPPPFGAWWWQYEADSLQYQRSPILNFYPPSEHYVRLDGLPWFLAGPGLWGKPLPLRSPLHIPLTPVELFGDFNVTEWYEARGISVEYISVDGGCHVLRFTGLLDLIAESQFCGHPLASRVTITSPERITYRIQLLSSTDGFPQPPLPPRQFQVEPIDRLPVDGSGLPFTLEDAWTALTLDPRTSAWLAEHPAAVAMTGVYHARGPKDCALAGCPHQALPVELAHQWELRWVDPAGAWLRTHLVKPALPHSAPAVLLVAQGDGQAAPPLAEAMVPLAYGLEVWRPFGCGRLWAISYDLGQDSPGWRFEEQALPSAQEPQHVPGPAWYWSSIVDGGTGHYQSGSRTKEAGSTCNGTGTVETYHSPGRVS
jgi:hypothetical protein